MTSDDAPPGAEASPAASELAAPPAPEAVTDRTDSIARNTAFAFGSQLATAGFTAALTLFLVRALGPDEYGVLSVALAVGALVILPADFGISTSAARFIAERRDDPSAVAAVVATAIRLKVVIVIVAAGGFAAAAVPIAAAYDSPDLVWPLRATALMLLGRSFYMLFGMSFVALGQVSRNFLLVTVESAVESAASVALVLLGAGAAGAALGRALGYIAGAALGLVMILRRLGRGLPGLLALHGHARSMARYAGALLVIDAAITLFAQVDVLIIGAVIGTTAAGFFEAPMRLVTVLAYPALAVALSLGPRFTRARPAAESRRVLASALRTLIIVQAAFAAAVVAAAGPIVRLLLGPEYEASVDVLRAVAPFVFLSGFGPLLSSAANFLGEARRRVPVAVAAVTINVVVDLVLIPRIGIVGGRSAPIWRTASTSPRTS